MKKQINSSVKAYLIRGAFYLLLLLAVCAIPFALAQRNAKRSVSSVKSKQAVGAKLASAASRVPGSLAVTPQRPPAKFQSQLPYDLRALPPQAPKFPHSSIRTRVNPVVGGGKRVSQVPNRISGPTGLTSIPVLPHPKAPQVVLYDQYNNNGPNATLSATFTDFPTFSADLADDFVVPAGQTWNISSIDADGVYFNGPGPASSFNVFIYANNGTLPGTQVFSATNISISQVGTTFTANLSPAACLTEGTYWIEIQANMTFGTQGEWGWTDRTVQSNNSAAWQNTGGGFGVCPTWMAKLICIPTASGPDCVYRLNGTTGSCGGGTPTPTPTGTPAGCTDYTTSTGQGAIVQAIPTPVVIATIAAPQFRFRSQ